MRIARARRLLPAGPAALALSAVMALSATALHAQDRFRSWGMNSFGVSGLVEMPSAFSRPDGEFSLNAATIGDDWRVGMSFQISPRLYASFRYSRIGGVLSGNALHDRSFSLHYRFMDEGDWRPAMAVGVNDVLGTGIYGGEYLVASKTLTPRLRATLGLGWGRLASRGGFSNPLGVFADGFKTRPINNFGLGGNASVKTWFRGDAALFGGLEWMVNDRLRLAVEYSSDAYLLEAASGGFASSTPINLGATWRMNDRTTLSAALIQGRQLGLQVNFSLDPRRSRFGSGTELAPPPVVPRSSVAARSWGDLGAGGSFESRLARDLAGQGLVLEGLETGGRTLRVSIRNDRYGTTSQAVGRAARVLSALAPAEVDRFDIILAAGGMPVTSVVIERDELERLEFHNVAPDLLRVATSIEDEPRGLSPIDGRWPVLEYGVGPYFLPGFFDPDSPLRADVGIVLWGRYEPAPGLVLAGRLQHRLAGNLGDSVRQSGSVLPHVRSDSGDYFREGDTTIQELTGSWYFRPGENLFGRVTVGLLEMMYGGVSAELLWKPQNSALALGVELNRVRQRDFDQLFGFRDYEITTGHASAYYEMGKGYQAQVDVGRYLAGDWGATLTLAREFDNGWRVGAFATKTDVSAADFGEGSFDKGIVVTIPMDYFIGTPTKQKYTHVLRSLQRDGGARVGVSGRLYDTVRNMQATEMDPAWGRFWK